MKNKNDLQVENGNYTRIINPLIEQLIKIPFKGCELAVALFIIRKTYGFNKIEDEISISQFCDGLGRSRQTIVTALKNLQLVNVARLVKQGNSKNSSNIWAINKYYESWKLVNMARLVKRKRGTSLTEAPQLVKTARHTKDNKYNITKDNKGYAPEVVDLMDFFRKTVNPHLTFNNKTEYESAKHLFDTYGLEKTKLAINYLEEKRKTDKFIPLITTPYELWTKWAKIKQYLESKNIKQKGKIWKPSQSLSSPPALATK